MMLLADKAVEKYNTVYENLCWAEVIVWTR